MRRLLYLLGVITALKHSERRAFTCRRGHYQIRKSTYTDACSIHVDEVGRFYIFNSNGIPDHDTGKTGPSIESQSIKLAIPKNPIILEEPECVGQGIVGVALNGVPIFNGKSNDCCDSAIKNLDQIDTCNGFASDNGIYRYNIYPICLQQCVSRTKSNILGVALDGFPIYGPVDDDGAQLTTRDLDECHGKWHGSEYRYHVTADYPYFINCFRGRVPAQNKQTPVRRRGRRSYSWREAARLPEWEQTFQLPLKMGDCKVCSSVKSCRNTGTAINSHSTRYPQTAGTETWNMPDNRQPYLSKAPMTARLEPRKKPMTRTLSHTSYYTPPKNQNVHNPSYNSNLSQLKHTPVPEPTTAQPSKGNLQIPRNKKSLFSLYRPQTTTRPFLVQPQWSTPQPTTKPNIPSRNAFNLKLSTRSHVITTRPRSNSPPGNGHGLNNSIQQKALSSRTTKPATSLKGMFNNIIRLKNSNVAPHKTHRQMQSTTGRKATTTSPSPAEEQFDLHSVLEQLRTGPGMRWKSTKQAAPVLTSDELRQMLEDTHVSKVGKRGHVDPLITLLEDDATDTKIQHTKKSGDTFGLNEDDSSKTREATVSLLTPLNYGKITKQMAQAPPNRTESIRKMWGNLNPNAARFRQANPLVSSAAPRSAFNRQRTTTTAAPKTTPPAWHRFTSTVQPWVKDVSDRMRLRGEVKTMDEFIMVNGVRTRIPDNIRFNYEKMKNNTPIPKNLQAEAAKIIEEVRQQNEYVKSAFAGGRRRRRRDTFDLGLDIFDALRTVRKKRGQSTSKKFEVGFLMRKEGRTIFKCQPPSFNTPSPSGIHINPKHLSPQLLAEMLKERKDVVRVKQSVFSRLFN